jgi:hypothetical protein
MFLFLRGEAACSPGGARRLNRIADRSIEVDYDQMLGFMNLPATQTSSAIRTMTLGLPTNP